MSLSYFTDGWNIWTAALQFQEKIVSISRPWYGESGQAYGTLYKKKAGSEDRNHLAGQKCVDCTEISLPHLPVLCLSILTKYSLLYWDLRHSPRMDLGASMSEDWMILNIYQP